MSGAGGPSHTVTEARPWGSQEDGAEAALVGGSALERRRYVTLQKAEEGEQMGGTVERWDGVEGRKGHPHWRQGPSEKLKGTQKWGRGDSHLMGVT